MTRAFTRQKPLSKTAQKAAAKVAAYEAAPRSGPIAPQNGLKLEHRRWVWHYWCDVEQRVITKKQPACFPRSTVPARYLREGTIDEIEMRENAGQLSMF